MCEETTRPVYDCDTQPYWCDEEAYQRQGTSPGRFIEDGRAYEILVPSTPRPWLNYLANARFGSVVSNRGLGFTFYRTTLLRITKYEHPVDYLPRDFVDGRTLTFHDAASGTCHSLLPGNETLRCIHRPGATTFTGQAGPLTFEITIFVPLEEPVEIWRIALRGQGTEPCRGSLRMEQIWSIAAFGIHTAEEGIPYLTTPGQDMTTHIRPEGVEAVVKTPALPSPFWAGFLSPTCGVARCEPLTETRRDGRVFTFNRSKLECPVEVTPGASTVIQALSIAADSEELYRTTHEALLRPGAVEQRYGQLLAQWEQWIDEPSCSIPDADLQNFLNVWFKNQLHLTFYFVRSGHHGYRDSLQDAWGYTLIDPGKARSRLVHILAHQNADGTAPRNFSAFPGGRHDHRKFMDSPVWIARTLVDLIRETGDVSLLNELVPFLDGSIAPVEEHAWLALDALYRNRNAQGLCHTGDGDWNDALEGISRDGNAVSAWLTMALFDALQHMIDLYRFTGRDERLATLEQRAAELKTILNNTAWDGAWYVYGFTGKGNPIGSHKNREGKIHLNAQAWAVFSGIAEGERADKVLASVNEHLATPLGPALLAPPYVHEGAEVGRIAKLEPGTFENGAVYQHAVAFHLFALLARGRADEAVDILSKILPTNPDNPDSRRTSEPYCTGNYYCGLGHARFGQNFFSWFTGNAAWFLRFGFDRLLGVRADFDGLRIEPCVPASWNRFTAKRRFRGCLYALRFQRAADGEAPCILVDGVKQVSRLITPREAPSCRVEVFY